MARVDRRRAQREARNARAAGRRRSGGGSRNTSARAVENQLFFTRLRNQAKWAFALMVVVFAVGFAFLGVGSGGLDLGSLVQDVFGSKGGGGTSISKAQAQIAKDPRNAAAYKTLADAYRQKGRTDDAIGALQQYVTLKPKDATQLQTLAQLQLTQADAALSDAQLAAFQQQSSLAGSPFSPAPSSKLGQALGSDPISSAVSTRDSSRAQQTAARYQSLATQALTSYKKLTKVRPNESSYFGLASAAEHFNDVKTAVAAYKALIRFQTDPTTKARIRARIKSLEQSLPTASQGGG